MYEMFKENLIKVFSGCSSGNLCLDEQMLKFYGKCSFRQHVGRKPVKFGLKQWCLADNELNCVINIDLYLGGGDNETTISDVVYNLIQPYEDETHDLYYDNLFASVDVSLNLYQKGINTTSTCRMNRVFIPNIFKEKMKHKEYCALKLSYDCVNNCEITIPLYALNYNDKVEKSVIMMTTKEENMVFNKKEICFEIQRDYNMNMGMVDSIDRTIRLTSCRRNGGKLENMEFFNLVDISTINS